MLHLGTETTLAQLQAALDARSSIVVTTSGSTGNPKRVHLGAAALEASVRASAEVIGEGNWYLCLPLQYIAGVQVVNRARVSGGQLVTREQASSFAAAVKALAAPRYTSVVPSQLQSVFERVVDEDPVVAAEGEAELAALAQFHTILVGGQSLPERLRRRARAAGLRLVETYGSAETAGGCVYDGVALPGVRVWLRPSDERILLEGLMLAEGYVDADGRVDQARTYEHFLWHGGGRWYLSDDRGELGQQGQLEVRGRVDEVIISGGLKLDLAEVQRWLDTVCAGAVAFPASSARWGQRLGVFLTAAQFEHAEPLRQQLVDHFGVQAAPAIVSASIAPLLPNGKLDRQVLANMVADE